MRWVGAALTAALIPVALPAPTWAQQQVGDNGGALPGLVRVGAASRFDTGLVVSGLAGYGYQGAVVAESDDHHRAALDLASSFRPLPWLAFAARFSGRYDRHTHTGSGKDSGWVGDPRLSVRATAPVGRGLWLAAHGCLWVPGGDAPSLDAGAATIDLLGLASWSPEGKRYALSAQGGVRFDRSAESVERPEELSRSDRLALGVSESNALLVGAGAAVRTGATEWIGEWSWDVLVGDRAPGLRNSPMRLGAGLRHPLSRTLRAQLLLEYSLAERPDVDSMGALFPVEPRFQALAGLIFQPAAERDRPAGGLVTGSKRPGEDRRPDPGEANGGKVGQVAVEVTSESGAAVVDAEVELTPAGDPAGPPRAARTGHDGRVTFTGVERGPARIQVRHPHHRASAKTIQVLAGTISTASFALGPALPPGQLRGVVRSFLGRPLAAELKVSPIEVEVRCDRRGEFEIDLPPGDYEVSVNAIGYRAQRRRVRIEKDGVTILNVDLRR